MTEKQCSGTNTSCLTYRGVWLIKSLDAIQWLKTAGTHTRCTSERGVLLRDWLKSTEGEGGSRDGVVRKRERAGASQKRPQGRELLAKKWWRGRGERRRESFSLSSPVYPLPPRLGSNTRTKFIIQCLPNACITGYCLIYSLWRNLGNSAWPNILT